MTEGETYYFKVEPIRWRIISENSESAMLLCDSIIDHCAYQSEATKSGDSYYVDGAPDGTYANNYEYSEIRAWLNGTFFETAFTKLQQQIILETDVNNRAASAGSPSSPYACENTQDFVFLLSYEDIKTEAYGFTAAADEKDPCRALLTSDYARATGTLMKTVDGYYGNGTWWLRSASASGYTNSAYRIDTFGKVDKGYVNSVQYGVVPALIIKL